MKLTSTLQRGNSLVETMIALVALSPFLAGIVLLGKQLDVKHKSFDALRYTLWERTVWSERAKPQVDLASEALDRAFGDPRAGLLPIESLRADGVSQNPFWRYKRQSLLANDSTSAVSSRVVDDEPPVDVGYMLVRGLAHGTGSVGAAAGALQMNNLGLSHRAFAGATIETNIRPLLSSVANRSSAEQRPLVQRVTGAVLSDTWSPRDEHEFSHKVDRVTANELIETLEQPGRPIAFQALSKGGPLYGEGQYGWDPGLRPRSNALPSAYVVEREDE
jgi:hypothetical protein